MNFTLSINEEHLEIIRSEAKRLGIPIASYLKMKALADLNKGASSNLSN